MKMRTRMCGLLGAVVLVAGIVTPVTATAAEVVDAPILSAAEIDAKAEVLAEKYTEVGQILSKEDATFVRTYLAGDDQPRIVTRAAAAGTPVNKSRTVKGHTGKLTGNMKINLAGGLSIDNSYSVSLKATGSSGITRLDVCAHIRAYGVVGSSGLGLVYTEDPCAKPKSGRSYSFAPTKRFSAFAVAGTITSHATFYYKGGSFAVSS